MHHASILHGLPLLTQYLSLGAIAALLCVLWRYQGLTGEDGAAKPQDPMAWNEETERRYR